MGDRLDLVGAQEIEGLLGVSRQRVQQLVNQHDFPPPVARLAMGKVWTREDVLAWACHQGRSLPKAAGAAPTSG